MTTRTETYLGELVEASKVAARQAKHETTTEDVADAVATRVLRDVRAELRARHWWIAAGEIADWAAARGLDLTEEA